MLPTPKDPNFRLPIPSEEEFMREAPEDEALLETGAWDDEPDDDEAGEDGKA